MWVWGEWYGQVSGGADLPGVVRQIAVWTMVGRRHVGGSAFIRQLELVWTRIMKPASGSATTGLGGPVIFR